MNLQCGADMKTESLTSVYLDGKIIGICTSPLLSKEQQVQYARLWAAAPDLLAACEAANNYGSRGELDGGISISTLLENAIAKARGTP